MPLIHLIITPDVFGYAGTFFLTMRFVPQLARAWDSPLFGTPGDNDGYNLLDFTHPGQDEPTTRGRRVMEVWIIICEGLTCVCFMIYATLIHAFPVLLANIICFFSCMMLSILNKKRITHIDADDDVGMEDVEEVPLPDSDNDAGDDIPSQPQINQPNQPNQPQTQIQSPSTTHNRSNPHNK